MHFSARFKPVQHGLLAILFLLLSACGGTSSGPIPTDTPARPPTIIPTGAAKATTPGTRVAVQRTPTPAATAVDCKKTLVGGRTPKIPTITMSVLAACRPQVKDTILWISSGKFAFQQDDQTFGNYEGYLPNAAKGTYREYTVLTPGERDRGARRIITSGATTRKSVVYKEIYYTDDHYETFWLVVSGAK